MPTDHRFASLVQTVPIYPRWLRVRPTLGKGATQAGYMPHPGRVSSGRLLPSACQLDDFKIFEHTAIHRKPHQGSHLVKTVDTGRTGIDV